MIASLPLSRLKNEGPFYQSSINFFKQRIFPFSMVTTFIFFNATSLLRAVTTRPSSAPLTPGAPSKALTSTPLVRALLPLIFLILFYFSSHFFTYFYLSTHIPNLFEDRDSKAKKYPTCCCDITSMALLFVVFRTFRTL